MACEVTTSQVKPCCKYTCLEESQHFKKTLNSNAQKHVHKNKYLNCSKFTFYNNHKLAEGDHLMYFCFSLF